MMISRRLIGVLLVACIATVSCASSGPAKPAPGANDPFEKFNRGVYRFNDGFDRHMLKPTAEAYDKHVPGPIKTGVHNFFNNLVEPTTIINDVLQGKGKQAMADTWRFTFNSTIGLLGFIDVASKLGLERHDEDFGQTFAVWGIPEGPYLVLPVLGPSSVRAGVGLIPYYAYTYPVTQLKPKDTLWGLTAVNAVQLRASLLEASNLLQQAALDPYIFLREAYRQRRLNLIYDGNPPLDYPLE
jgi:phospholipid-binding lipoprotein MlaA